jgi:hypothetical protein
VYRVKIATLAAFGIHAHPLYEVHGAVEVFLVLWQLIGAAAIIRHVEKEKKRKDFL